MSTLDRVIELQNQGFSDDQIVEELQNEGIYPQEIRDSLNQANVKNAVSQESVGENPQQGNPQENYSMEPPIPSQESYDQNQNYYPQAPQAYSNQSQGYYPQQGYQSSENLSEIAEQVVSEKLDEFRREVGDISGFKENIQGRISELNERIKRIENTIDKLQHSIIGKIGEFEDNASAIHKDLDNLHGTVSKLMNPLVDNYKELKKLNRNKKE